MASNARFDYVVVGAGSAGCVLANRLSADPSARVLLLEAGPPDRHPFIAMPAGFPYVKGKPRYDWGYASEPEPYLHDRRIPCPRGRVLGGSSSINAMAFVRGQAEDYDDWARAGLEGWGFADCLPYFKKLETFIGPPSPVRGDSGPLHVTAPVYSTPLNELFLSACQEAGYKSVPDTNGPVQEGFGPMDQTIYRGVRESTARAYIRPVAGRPNLTVRTSCNVLDLVWAGARTTGVRYLQNGRVHEATAEREIILSAGAINSPHLLMLSGIGPADELRKAGIPVKVDLPGVGQNLQDHVGVDFKQACPRPVTGTPMLQFRRKVPIFLSWALRRKGPGATNHFEVAGYLRSQPSVERPDIQILFIPMLTTVDGLAVGSGHGYQASIMALRPESRGEIKLRPGDPRQRPALHFNYLKQPDDIVPLREGIRRLREILSQRSFDGLRGVELRPEPGCTTDAELDAFIRSVARSVHHPSGTCRMGHDELAVVDPAGRVRGVDNLRVVDASIMPAITSGNINAPIIMMAEKLSDAIIQGRTRIS